MRVRWGPRETAEREREKWGLTEAKRGVQRGEMACVRERGVQGGSKGPGWQG